MLINDGVDCMSEGIKQYSCKSLFLNLKYTLTGCVLSPVAHSGTRAQSTRKTWPVILAPKSGYLPWISLDRNSFTTIGVF